MHQAFDLSSVRRTLQHGIATNRWTFTDLV